jgi:AcrR family transcriptional regulator
MAMHSRAMAKPLHQLSPHHRQAVALRLAGERPQAIADSLGVERRTVYLWFGDPLVKGELERRSRDLAKLITERLADHTLAALSRLREIIELPLDRGSLTPAQKLEAIREILDRCVYTVRIADGTPNPTWGQGQERRRAAAAGQPGDR